LALCSILACAAPAYAETPPPGTTAQADHKQAKHKKAIRAADVAAIRLHPDWQTTRKQIGKASWYGGRHSQGRRTASGARFDQAALTAAHPTLPLQSTARVTNLQNGRSVTVTVTDRGPRRRDSIIDLSQSAAEQLGMKNKGIAVVQVQPLDTVPARR
jgi:rare lipoprotein A